MRAAAEPLICSMAQIGSFSLSCQAWPSGQACGRARINSELLLGFGTEVHGKLTFDIRTEIAEINARSVATMFGKDFILGLLML